MVTVGLGEKMNRIFFFMKFQINQAGFKISFAVLALLNIIGMVMGYIQNYQNDFVFIRSAADNFLLTSTDSRTIRMAFALCFPLLASSLCNGSKAGSGLFSMLRMDKKQYIYENAVVAVIVTVISFMAALGLNQLLCFAAFPLSGSDNRWGMREYGLLDSFQADLLFDIWSIQNPYLYNFLYIVIISVLAGGIAFLTYGLGYIKSLGHLKPVQLSALVFIAFIALFVISGLLHVPAINFISYVEPGRAVSVLQYVFFTGCIYIAGLVLTIRGKKIYEYL